MRSLFEPRAAKIINFGWDHGRYGDYWSAVHFLTGILLGIIAYAYGLSAHFSFVIVAGIAALYEGLEMILHVSEDAENVLTDVILTAAGAPAAYYVINMTDPHHSTLFVVFGIIAIIDAFLFSLGWRHYLRKRIEGV